MSLFRRLASLIILLIGIVASIAAVLAIFFTRMMVRPPRQKLWASPSDFDLPFEDIQFPARDGIRLSGWLIPAPGTDGKPASKPITTLIMVHGWPWNRIGTTAENIFTDLPGAKPLNFLPLARSLHHAGYQLLMFDLRNHGESASSEPYAFGFMEANDLLGALEYLAGRKDVDEDRLGVIGFSSGANTMLFALPQTNQVRAAIAVQPTSPNVFGHRFAASVSGPLSTLVLPLTELLYRLLGGMRFAAVEPLFSLPGIGSTPVMYVQGSGDPWGSVGNVNQMAAITPNVTDFLIVDTDDRFGGYQHVIDNPHIVDEFFRTNIR
jgi:pimeloyl-ACP methyl ester carboxylesterase